MEKRACDTKRELLFEENLEHFNKLWENAGKEAGVEKRVGIIGLNVFLRRQEGLRAEARTVVMTVGGTPHPLGGRKADKGL